MRPSTERDRIAERLRSAGCVFAEREAELLIAEAGGSRGLDAMVAERASGRPLEQVLGWAEFCGLRIGLDPGVFVPRARTEFLVERAVSGRLPARRPVVVDLCCGSGAVGAAVAERLGRVELHAVDIDPAALACARRNIGGGEVHEGDLFGPLPAGLRGRIGIITANLPYVPTGEIATMPREARLHESPVALDGGEDGLDVLRRVAAEAPRWLAPGGRLLVETALRQAADAVEAFAARGLLADAETCERFEAAVIVGARRA